MTEQVGNYISVTLRVDRRVALVQIWIGGKPEGWIEYNAAQLGGLIELLVQARGELKEEGDAGEDQAAAQGVLGEAERDASGADASLGESGVHCPHGGES